VAADGVQLAALLKESKATFMQPTPITWQLLLEAEWEGSPDLKIISTGEPLPRELAARLVSKGAGLWNLYGPTETTIWSTGCQITAGDTTISIGRPIANTQVYVLDARFEPVPIGVIGELYIGGEGLARGYLNRPDLTAEKFVRNPFADSGSSSRLYRTGDLARLRVDGTIECLGRVDQQVKLRGYRIELGEIEAGLSRHASVGQSAVVARLSPRGERMLVAYFETRGNSAPTTSDLRTHLRSSLPEHMVPSTFVPMDRLPLTPNGKIDRRALQSASEARVDANEDYVAPRDALETAIAGVWAKALGVPRVGIHDNFFELGGHSLRAAVLLAEVRKVTGETLPLATLFQAASVAEFAALLREGGWHASWSSLVPIQPVGSRSPVFLVHGAEGNVLLYRSLAQHLGPDQPVYGLQARGLNGTGHMDTSVQEMASAYIKEIMSVQPRGPYHLGGYCMGGIIAFEMAQQLRQMGEQVKVVMMLETYNDASTSRATASALAPLHFLQNVWFHCANALSAPAKDQKKFLREKLDIGLTRLRLRYDALLNVFNRSAEKTSHAYPYLKVKRINDKAALEYSPQPYDGRVAVMRPKGHFLGFPSRTMGWEGLARGGVSVHEIPAFPKGMLVEPFAHHLAEAVRACMQGS
jgi:thioesterase domain-containing protein